MGDRFIGGELGKQPEITLDFGGISPGRTFLTQPEAQRLEFEIEKTYITSAEKLEAEFYDKKLKEAVFFKIPVYTTLGMTLGAITAPVGTFGGYSAATFPQLFGGATISSLAGYGTYMKTGSPLITSAVEMGTFFGGSYAIGKGIQYFTTTKATGLLSEQAKILKKGMTKLDTTSRYAGEFRIKSVFTHPLDQPKWIYGKAKLTTTGTSGDFLTTGTVKYKLSQLAGGGADDLYLSQTKSGGFFLQEKGKSFTYKLVDKGVLNVPDTITPLQDFGPLTRYTYFTSAGKQITAESGFTKAVDFWGFGERYSYPTNVKGWMSLGDKPPKGWFSLVSKKSKLPPAKVTEKGVTFSFYDIGGIETKTKIGGAYETIWMQPPKEIYGATTASLGTSSVPLWGSGKAGQDLLQVSSLAFSKGVSYSVGSFVEQEAIKTTALIGAISKTGTSASYKQSEITIPSFKMPIQKAPLKKDVSFLTSSLPKLDILPGLKQMRSPTIKKAQKQKTFDLSLPKFDYGLKKGKRSALYQVGKSAQDRKSVV